MTREEARKILQKLATNSLCVEDYSNDKIKISSRMGAQALRPASREQVEKVWRGEWEWYDEEIGSPLEGTEREWGWRCSKCKVVLPDDFDDPDNPPAMRFCQWCGAPMTDEAVEMVMERMEEM
uniref:Rubredoxin loop, ELECTRON TRANSPORT n=1 Tax=Myoviridae sp. ctr0w28 TaxID=2826703 RepID=A0A8S5NRI8_9CAUD|nr:MAG TPA: Rubredoxin loop, ELECTRON TRANSPORT [Myoviridae sp. ctr0w28]